MRAEASYTGDIHTRTHQAAMTSTTLLPLTAVSISLASVEISGWPKELPYTTCYILLYSVIICTF